ncbi:MAG: hypothetical protein WCV50_00820 [Patescibacteria group bacterium]|jgi:hypothetical protein
MTVIYEKPHEIIRVFADFQVPHLGKGAVERFGNVRPVAFFWGGRRYEVKKVNLIFRKQRGDRYDICFAVSDEANAFVLSYNPESMEWWLEEVRC